MEALGNRMKNNYEDRQRFYLTRRTPVIMRLDGRAFHTFTKNWGKPFCDKLHFLMIETAKAVLNEVQGSKLAYVQSDEISLLITDFDTLETEAWFDYNIQKMCSIGAAVASTKFMEEQIRFNIDEANEYGLSVYPDDFRFGGSSYLKLFKQAQFDCRVFNIPKEEVANYFIWRQQDWFRNSIMMYARSFFSHKELDNKNSAEVHEMLHQIGKNWATDLEDWKKNGTFILRGKSISESMISPNPCPIFTTNRDAIEVCLG